MEKQIRDEMIESKVKDLHREEKKLKVILENLERPRTNLKITFPDETNQIILRVIKDPIKLTWILGKLINLEEIWKKGLLEVGLILTEENLNLFKIDGYKISDWIKDIKILIEKLEIEEKLDKIKNGIQTLPKYLSNDKKDEIEFNKLMDSL